MRVHPYFYVDRHTRVVVRGPRAVPLSILEFALLSPFRWPTARFAVPSRELVDRAYQGVANPPLDPYGVVRAAMVRMTRKLAHVHMGFRANNHSQHSFYQLVVEPFPRSLKQPRRKK